MIFEVYDYISGKVIDQADALDFGDLIQRQHCVKPIVFRGLSDTETVTPGTLKIYLEDKGAWQDTDFGYYKSATFVPSIESGSPELSNHFEEVPNATPADPGGVSLDWHTDVSDYLWIDAQVTELADGVNEANFRIFYDFT
jgi:hypothetical protein